MKLPSRLIMIISTVFISTMSSLPIINITPNALAQTSNQESGHIVRKAKTDRIVGEQMNGYLGLIDLNAPLDVVQAVNVINLKRKKFYETKARSLKQENSETAAKGLDCPSSYKMAQIMGQAKRDFAHLFG